LPSYLGFFTQNLIPPLGDDGDARGRSESGRPQFTPLSNGNSPVVFGSLVIVSPLFLILNLCDSHCHTLSISLVLSLFLPDRFPHTWNIYP